RSSCEPCRLRPAPGASKLQSADRSCARLSAAVCLRAEIDEAGCFGKKAAGEPEINESARSVLLSVENRAFLAPGGGGFIDTACGLIDRGLRRGQWQAGRRGRRAVPETLGHVSVVSSSWGFSPLRSERARRSPFATCMIR